MCCRWSEGVDQSLGTELAVALSEKYRHAIWRCVLAIEPTERDIGDSVAIEVGDSRVIHGTAAGDRDLGPLYCAIAVSVVNGEVGLFGIGALGAIVIGGANQVRYSIAVQIGDYEVEILQAAIRIGHLETAVAVAKP